MFFMTVIGIGLIRMRNLFAVVMLSGIYSLLAAFLYVIMDAVDVAFTEAAVGAGIATVLMLATLALTGTQEKPSRHTNLLSIAIVTVTGAALVYGTLDMPEYGDPDAPIHHHVVPRYMNDSAHEVGPPNVVTSVLASYRGFDTLGEVTVIFTAAVGVIALIGRIRRRRSLNHDARLNERWADTMSSKPVLRVLTKLIIPLIMLFALYVQFHGDYGPGGGFQAGVIFASALILYGLIFGIDTARRAVPEWMTRLGLALGVLMYAGTGVAGLVMGGNFLNYSVLAHDHLHGQHWGIFTIELGVGITVAAAMVTIFFTFARLLPVDPNDEKRS
ncbi:MAG: Na(+)/H(+) antiporter subunit B [Hyphomicrobiales bacterium]|nr:Na(+)/H(+) antiporter subunit B [Hyphomicrobiales bacterium]